MKNNTISRHISEVKKGNRLSVDGYVIEATSDAYMTKTDNGREWNFENNSGYHYASDFEGGLVDVVVSMVKRYAATSFIDDVVAGRAVEDDLDDYIEYWHTHETGKSLHEYLGMSNDVYGRWLTNSSLLSEIINQRLSIIIRVPYISVWDGGTEITTTATVNIKTGEVTDIAVVNVAGLDVCEREYIMMNDEQVDIYHDDHGYEHWADIQNKYGGSEMKEISAKCLNGDLRVGDLVLSVPDDCYSCLIGRVLEIHPVGTPEHDAETENDTDSIHVDFLEYDYKKCRIEEIEKAFSELYGTKKRFYECPLDDVIMSPESLIRISGIDDSFINDFLESGYIAARYCYNILRKLTEKSESDNTPPVNTMPDIKLDLMDTIESSVTLAGYEVLDGDRDSFIVRHGKSDADYEIKVTEMMG